MTVTHLKKFALIAGIASSALLLQGCVAALAGGAAVAAATKVGTDPRTMGTQLDDETLEFKVQDAINSDGQIKEEGRVLAISYSGRVLLIGQVPNENLKEVATGLARGVQGVNDVYNELQIGTPITIGQKSKDSWITAQIKSKMLVDSTVKATDVKAITENNVVYLLGNVTPSQGDAAANIARNVAGVEKVVKSFKYL